VSFKARGPRSARAASAGARRAVGAVRDGESGPVAEPGWVGAGRAGWAGLGWWGWECAHRSARAGADVCAALLEPVGVGEWAPLWQSARVAETGGAMSAHGLLTW
jgi:hypothetical protein